MIEIRKAERRKAKLRIGMSGPSGSGKTYSALLTARGLASSWDKIALIDTENGSGELYSDLGPYNVITLTAPYAPERYIEAIAAAESAGMEVIIIDSTSHEWDGKGGCLELNETLAKAKYRGNTWSAWSETTPRHQRFIEAIVMSPCHVVTTARSKTDTIQTKEGDRTTIKKVGMKEIQRDGFEYELTVNFNLDRDGHFTTASKDRTGLFIDRDPFKVTEETGKELLAWGESGKEVPPPPPPDYSKEKSKIAHNLKRLGFTVTAESAPEIVTVLTGHELTEEKYADIVRELEAYKGAEGAQAAWALHVEKARPAATPDVHSESSAYPEEEISPEDIPF